MLCKGIVMAAGSTFSRKLQHTYAHTYIRIQTYCNRRKLLQLVFFLTFFLFTAFIVVYIIHSSNTHPYKHESERL